MTEFDVYVRFSDRNSVHQFDKIVTVDEADGVQAKVRGAAKAISEEARDKYSGDITPFFKVQSHIAHRLADLPAAKSHGPLKVWQIPSIKDPWGNTLEIYREK